MIKRFTDDLASFHRFVKIEPPDRLAVPIELAGGNPNHDERGRFASGEGGPVGDRDAATGKRAKRAVANLMKYPTTDDLEKAGFLRPDGKMVDLSKGTSTRTIVHEAAAGGYLELGAGLKAGFIRFNPEFRSLEMDNEPTEDQFKQLYSILQDRAKGEVFDAEMRNGERHQCLAWPPSESAAKVITDIKKFYAMPQRPVIKTLAQQFHTHELSLQVPFELRLDPSFKEREGRWITLVGGHHVFIPEGSTTDEAIHKVFGRKENEPLEQTAPKVKAAYYDLCKQIETAEKHYDRMKGEKKKAAHRECDKLADEMGTLLTHAAQGDQYWMIGSVKDLYRQFGRDFSRPTSKSQAAEYKERAKRSEKRKAARLRVKERKQPAIAASLMLPLELGYDEDEARDDHGRWTASKTHEVGGLTTTTYTRAAGDAVTVMHSRYSSAMRRGSALNGYSEVMYHTPDNKDRFGGWNTIEPTKATTFRGDDHATKATKYLARKYKIAHKSNLKLSFETTAELRLALEWDEDKHPRDQAGRFASGDGGDPVAKVRDAHPEFAGHQMQYVPSLGETIARYEPDGTIKITDAFLGHDKENQREILAHEVGHGQVAYLSKPEHSDEFFKLVDSGALGHYDEQQERFVGLWGQRNADEVLADLAAKYYLDKAALKEKYPKQYDVIEKVLQNAPREVGVSLPGEGPGDQVQNVIEGGKTSTHNVDAMMRSWENHNEVVEKTGGHDYAWTAYGYEKKLEAPHLEKLVKEINRAQGSVKGLLTKWENQSNRLCDLEKERNQHAEQAAKDYLPEDSRAAHRQAVADIEKKMADLAPRVDRALEFYRKASDTKMEKMIGIVRGAIQDRLQYLLKPSQQVDMNLDAGDADASVAPSVKKATELLRGCISEDVDWRAMTCAVKKPDPAIYGGTRAYFSTVTFDPAKPALGSMCLPPNTDYITIIHEFGHCIEQDPKVHEAVAAFLQHRVKGEKPFSMAERYPNCGYEPHELGREDDFTKVWGKTAAAGYTGKFYEGPVTEVLSMGMQKLFFNPREFAEKDPEYFKFTVGILDGTMLTKGK